MRVAPSPARAPPMAWALAWFLDRRPRIEHTHPVADPPHAGHAVRAC